MKKLVPVLVIAMVFALAFTVAVSAAERVDFSLVDGVYNISYDLTKADQADVADDTMFGMVVIEATEEPAKFELTENNIRYIDQGTSQDNMLSFDTVIPMNLANNGTYYVYIGGGDLGTATCIGTLSAGTTEPSVTNVALTADAVNWNDVVTVADIEVGETLASAVTIGSTAAKATVNGTEYAGTITVVGGTEATTVAGTQTVTVKFVPTAVANTTFTPAEITKNFNVTVNAAASGSTLSRGDANGDGNVDGQDHQRVYEHLNGSNPIAQGTPEYVAADANEDGSVDGQDHQRIYEHLNGSNPLS